MRLGRHLSTLLGTAATLLGTAAAVVGRVLGALGGAGVARLDADTTDGGGQRRTSAHEAGTGPAQLCAVSAGPDTIGHFRFRDASIAAVLTRASSGHARLDAILEGLVGHDRVLSFWVGKNTFGSWAQDGGRAHSPRVNGLLGSPLRRGPEAAPPVWAHEPHFFQGNTTVNSTEASSIPTRE